MQQLYDRMLPQSTGKSWMGEPEVWQAFYNVDPGELWETHYALKNLLLAFVRRRVSRQCRRRGESDEVVEAARNLLDPNVLTIGFARRFATYKRADLILHATSIVLAELVNDTAAAVQFIFAGKAHPADEPGKQLDQEDRQPPPRQPLRRSHGLHRRLRHQRLPPPDPRRRRLAQQPAPPAGSLGHQRQKAVLNGGLNLSMLDGWWAEAYDGKNGFAIGEGRQHVDDEITDARDAENLCTARCEEEVIPLYYDRDADGLPRRWIEMMIIHQLAGLAIQRPPHGHGLRAQVLPAAAGGLSCEMNRR